LKGASTRTSLKCACWVIGFTAGLAARPVPNQALAKESGSDIRPILSHYCFECHGKDLTEGQINLEEMTGTSDFGRRFKDWEKVDRMLRGRKMPPKKMPQPSDSERTAVIQTVANELDRFITQHAGDPGRVVVRRLTSAEYAYTIQDLTGLELNALDRFLGDAASGEGFTNSGAGQFMQDSTLERYLEMAKVVAGHAVIGAGPLEFYADPGQTGRELSAITRIQTIYRKHGFRTAAGEGARPFGLDLYPRAMFVAWQFRFRDELGLADDTLPQLAEREGLSIRLCEHVWSVVNKKDTSFPLSIIISAWQALPPPAQRSPETTRKRCLELSVILREWQKTLAAAAGDEEEAAVLTAGDVQVATTHTLAADLLWPKGSRVAKLEFAVSRASKHPAAGAVVVWQNARLRFRREDGFRSPYQPLKEFAAPESARRLAFGNHPKGTAVGEADFVIAGEVIVPVSLQIPKDMVSAQLLVDVRLETKHEATSIVRCRISGGEMEGVIAGATGATSTLLAGPANKLVEEWRHDVAEFARLLPEVSHREPAPSDRDPIPRPYDSTYNKPERNHFHTTIKYNRDDDFFVSHVADDATRRRLEEAWTDLLTSFEFHDANLRFVARKFAIDLGGRSIANLDRAVIDRLPEAPRVFVDRWAREYGSMQHALLSAQQGHVEGALAFAERAWRRPLSADEQKRSRAFYAVLREQSTLDHTAALRALLARILLAPAFLYRVEPPGQRQGIVPLSDRQLASRLSYFVWSSLPDEELRQAAAMGRLHEPRQLEEQTRRMLRDPKARRLATEFFGQWLGFYRFDGYQGIDTKRFPEFTDRLKSALYEESVSFFEHIVRNDRPVDEIVFADYSFWNRPLAEHYGITAKNLSNGSFTRVDGIARHHRGGLLGLGAVLTVTSAPLRTSAVKRGDWVLRRVVGTPVPPPPADVGSIPADDVSADKLTLQRRLEAHRSSATCNSCHSRIDPLGFALEQYDPIGRWRDTYRDGQKIETSGTLSDGTRVSGPDGLRDYLRREKAKFHRTISVKLLAYALGRSELASDRPLIDVMVKDVEQGRLFSDMVVQIVQSKQFRYQRAD
jgi:Protein of unknown function (DUF1592)/Protein of unknown function (DUF1588)/Protein of unknown function (DUF1585)/Protein of unknown function (DUF1587)/Protein of unknown function (DUF1595)